MGWSGIKDYGFGSQHRTKEQDAEYRSRCRGVKKKRVWTKERCAEQLDFLLTALKKILVEAEKMETDDKKKKNETIRDLVTMINKILDVVKYLYPPVSKIELDANISLRAMNVEVSLNQMAERYAEMQMLKTHHKDWVKKFGEKQADAMNEAITHKYNIGRQKLEEIREGLRTTFLKSGLAHYEKKVDIEDYEEEDYEEIEKGIVVKEIEEK